MIETEERRGLMVFGTVWFGQMVSLVGDSLSQFAIGVYVYERTGSATLFALLNVFVYLPQILFTPIAGVLADRHSRRKIMIVANVVGGVAAGLIVILLASGVFQLWLAYLAALLFALAGALLYPAYSASVPMLVPKRNLGRANGMIQFATSAARVVAPLSAAFLLAAIKLEGIILLDLVTFLFAIATLLVVKIPQPPATGGPRGWGAIVREARVGWRYITERRGLVGLLLYFTVANIAAGFFTGLSTPLVLSFASTVQLGTVTSAGGLGLMLSSILMTVWGGPRRRINGVLATGCVAGLALIVMGFSASVVSISIGAFGFLFCVTVINVSNAAIWQSMVPPEMLGRVMSSIRLVAWSSLPVSLLLAGPLADHVFNPLLTAHGSLAGSVGAVLGVGPGRGVGLLLVFAGLLALIAGIGGYLSRAVRQVEDVEPVAERDAA